MRKRMSGLVKMIFDELLPFESTTERKSVYKHSTAPQIVLVAVYLDTELAYYNHLTAEFQTVLILYTLH